jgi:hypothetical protein
MSKTLQERLHDAKSVLDQVHAALGRHPAGLPRELTESPGMDNRGKSLELRNSYSQAAQRHVGAERPSANRSTRWR